MWVKHDSSGYSQQRHYPGPSSKICLIFALTFCLIGITNTAHEPEDGVPVFIRSTVESPPQQPEDLLSKLKQSMKPTFGETFLPLRSAVESIPPAHASEPLPTRSFVRDSIEYRIMTSDRLMAGNNDNADDSTRHHHQPLTAFQLTGQYSAFHIPTKYDTKNPQPYRSGSPYQQIIHLSSNEKLSVELERIEQLQQLQNDEASLKFRNDDDVGAASDKMKVLCYITNWSFYRLDSGKFVPENIDHNLCTHIIYSFGSLDPVSFTIKEFDPWVDVENDIYRRTTSLNIPILLAIGGWTDSTGDKYSTLISNPSSRNNFVKESVQYLKKYGFSGLHFDWNYPKCWQSDCRKGPKTDKPNFTKLIQEINREFKKQSPPLQLGVALSGYKEVIVEAYEVRKLSDAADFLTIMTYDYHGAWEDRTGHVSPLYGRSDDLHPQYNTDFTMKMLVKEGAAPEKLVMGIPFYGQSYTLKEMHKNAVGEGTPARGPGNPGEFTRQPGMLSYYEVCGLIRKQKWRTGRDNIHKTSPYATYLNQWVGYEDTESVSAKAKYVLNEKYGGIAAWTIDLDDFTNKCCYESFPLLKAINRVFGRIKNQSPVAGDCRVPEMRPTPLPPIMTISGEHGGGGNGGGGSGGVVHEHTTWPQWNPSTSIAVTTSNEIQQEVSTQSSSTNSWWQTSPTESSTWWAPTSTTERRQTTTNRPPTSLTSTTRPPTRPSVTTPPSSTEQASIIPVPVNVQPSVIEGERCDIGEYRSDPTDCNSYYRCVYGQLTKLNCAGGLHWNAKGTLCDWPAVAMCIEMTPEEIFQQQQSSTHRPSSTSSSPTTRRTTTRKSTTPKTTARTTTIRTTRRVSTTARPTSVRPTISRPSADVPRCNSGQYYPHKDCGSFYICVNEILIQNDCGSGLQWSQSQLGCNFASEVRCVSSVRYLNLIGKQRTSTLDDPCDGSTHVPYPGDCQKYLLCNHGQLQAADCAPGLHWNQNQRICDWPQSAQCTADGIEGNLETDGAEHSEVDDLNNEIIPIITSTSTSRPRPTTERPAILPHSGHFKLVCYFTNWAWYRSGVGKYTPDHIDTDLCTHIVYGFAVLDYSELTIRTHDSWADIDNNFYDRVARLKEKGITVSLALGGWNDSQGDKYSRLVRSPSARAKFVKHAVQFVERYGFGGLDLDWEYPVCWQTDCKKGIPDEKEGFTELVKELSVEFRPKGLVLSTAVSPSKQIIDAGYDVPTLSEYFDWIAIMTYDFHGQWDKKTGHVAPLYFHPDDEISHFNANFSLHYWMEKGAPARKLVMGMPLYGQSFTISNTKNTGLNSHAPGPGTAGEFTRAAGFLAYYEICDRVRNKGWTVVQDPRGRMGPYAYKGNQWVSYDDKEMLRKKSELIRSMGLGGGMVWALDLDDFKNRCDEGVHPLLTEIQRVLRDPPGIDELEEIPEIDDGDMLSGEEISHEEQMDTNDQEDQSIVETIPNEIPDDENFKVVCYFTNWAWYRQGGGKYVPEDIDADLCSHIVYGFAVLNRESLTIRPHDSWADIDNRFYERVVAFRAKGIKVTVAIGGWNDSAGDKYSRLVRSAMARAKFIEHVVQFIDKNGFDGLDLDWEYPVCWQVDCEKGFADEKEGFASLVRELSIEFKPRGWLLSSAVSPSKKVIDAGYDIPTLSKYFDWIAVMAYDYHGQWDKQTGHVAPMYEHPDDFEKTFNANFTMNYWISGGADRKKLIMGMPMYGQSFSLADSQQHDLNHQTYGGGEAGEGTRARGFLSYYEICQNIRKKNWQVVRDRKGRMGPYAYLRDQWVSFDDANMIRHKSEFVKAMGLGGAMIWALDLDDFRNVCDCEEYPLLKTINRVLRGYGGSHPKCALEILSEVSTEMAPIDNERAEDMFTTKRPSQYHPTKPPQRTSTRRPTQSPTLPPGDLDFSCNNRMFTAHESDCNKYYQCQFGTLLELSCPPGLHWNNDHCDWPQMSNCEFNAGMETEDGVDNGDIDENGEPEIILTTKKPKVPPKKPSVIIPNEVIIGDNGGNSAGSDGYKVICYFTNWAWYRPGQGKYTPDNIDENLCTHVVYGFAVLNRDTLTIKTHDSWADIDNRFYERVVSLREKGIRVTLAIGGWNDSLGDKYSLLVLNPEARARFVKHVTEFLEKYNFEGLDLDWEYPVCWQVECDKGSAEEKEGFASLVKELSYEFRPRGWLLSAAVSPSKKVIDAGYDVPTLAKHFDWIAVMTYDFHGHWDKQTGHVAPLYYYPGDKYDYFNANFSMNYWMELGAPAKKLIMGMPLYGQSFSLIDAGKRGLNDKASGPGDAGPFTRAAGFLAYYEICQKINNGGWTVVRDSEGRIGPYAHRGQQWVSYDDVEDIRRKTEFIKELGLGGGMVWALDLDDFRGRCGCGKHPLLRTINQGLRNIPGQRASDCT